MNNYDMSSSGENIEIVCFYDNDLARMRYEDFLSGLDGNPCERIELSRDNYVYLIGHDIDNRFYKKSELNKMTKNALYELAANYNLLGGYINDYTKQELISELLSVTNKQYYEMLAKESYWNGFSDNIKHDYYISCGYSQGDEVIVINLGHDYYDLNNTKHCESIDHIFWDSPISMRVTINDVEYYEDSFLDDCYSYDKSEVAEKIKAIESMSDYAKNWIISKLPEYPEYDY